LGKVRKGKTGFFLQYTDWTTRVNKRVQEIYRDSENIARKHRQRSISGNGRLNTRTIDEVRREWFAEGIGTKHLIDTLDNELVWFVSGTDLEKYKQTLQENILIFERAVYRKMQEVVDFAKSG